MERPSNILRTSIIALLLLAQACGGGSSNDTPPPDNNGGNTEEDVQDSGGYAGNEAQATVSSDNSKDLGIAATSGAQQITIQNQLVYPGASGQQATSFVARPEYTPSSTPEITDELNDQETADLCPHGGRAEYSSIEETADSFISVEVFTDCQYGEGLFLKSFTGSIRAVDPIDINDRGFYQVVNGTITGVEGIPRQVYTTVDCNESYSHFCKFSYDFNGYDDRIYRLVDFSITDEGSAVYTVAGRIYDPVHGYIDVTTEVPFTLDCPGERPGVGRLNFTGANQTSGSIEYISCKEYVISTSDGVSTTYSW
ncbi:MAG: hypothetical protein P8101_02605 [Candidatus Thiodiazotropha sp.]